MPLRTAHDITQKLGNILQPRKGHIIYDAGLAADEDADGCHTLSFVVLKGEKQGKPALCDGREDLGLVWLVWALLGPIWDLQDSGSIWYRDQRELSLLDLTCPS